MTTVNYESVDTFTSTFGNHQNQTTITKIVSESSSINGVFKPFDSNKKSVLQPVEQFKSALNNQLYIDSFCEKENQEVADHTRKSTIYQQEKRIIDLEEENFKLRQALIGINNPSEDTTQINHFMIEKQYKLRLESLTKQYELKLQKQEELSKLEIWKLKEDIETLNYQLRNAAVKQTTCSSMQRIEDEMITEYHQHCSICSNGEIIDRMCKMYNSLEDQHNNCLKYKKQVILKISCLEQQLQDVKKQLDRAEKQHRAFISKTSQLEKACKQLVREKNELDSSNIKLIEENARFKTHQDQLKMRQDHIRLREQQTHRSISRSQTTHETLHQQLTTKNAFPMKSSIIDRLHVSTSTNEYRRPTTGTGSLNKINTTLSFDGGQRASLVSQNQTSQKKYTSKIMGSLERLRVPEKTASSVAAILSSSSHHNLDTFRPKKFTQQYKYNI